jgi:hypothetical protein
VRMGMIYGAGHREVEHEKDNIFICNACDISKLVQNRTIV